MNKIGDVKMIYGLPTHKQLPIGEAKLLAKISPRSDKLEYWQIEFINEPGRTYNQFISVEDGEDKKQI